VYELASRPGYLSLDQLRVVSTTWSPWTSPSPLPPVPPPAPRRPYIHRRLQPTAPVVFDDAFVRPMPVPTACVTPLRSTPTRADTPPLVLHPHLSHLHPTGAEPLGVVST
jgi:hypothetical protein